MLWESGSDNKDDPNESGWMPNRNPLFPQVTPVLVPSQPGRRNVQQTVPVVVPDVEELKEQFQQQQNMLAQIKETIKENESQLSSKEKKVEAYANRLSQIRARAKKTDGRQQSVQSKPATTTSSSSSSSTTKPLSRKSSKENLSKETDAKDRAAGSKAKISPKGKINELKKKLEENKLKVKERAGKEVSETKKIESMVENLRMQLDERHVTIQELQKLVDEPPAPDVKSEAASRRSKGKSEGRTSASKSTQTTKIIQNDESTEIIALQNRIYELETNILDLEESLKEKESVIEARTQAVTLLSQDLSMKGKNTLESLEETRQEMRTMQNNFIIIENQLKKELVEKDDELSSLEERLKNLESTNADLASRNSELADRLAETAERRRCAESDSETRRNSNESIVQVRSDDEITELNNKINALNKELDDSNKSMIKMKLEHKNKIKSLNKTIEKLKETSDDKAEILRLQNKLDEFELVRESWQNKIAELEEEKVNEKRLKDQINELEAGMRQQAVDIERHLQEIANLEREKHDLVQSHQDQNILIENLYVKIQNLEQDNRLSEEKDARIAELSDKLKGLEEDHRTALETMKIEHGKEIEMLESYYGVRSSAGGDRKELEEYRISNEMNNVHVEEQIEMLVREKQQLLEKLKSLSGVSSTESFTFETVEHSDVQGPNESRLLGMETEVVSNESEEAKEREVHLQRITDEQQKLINELQVTVKSEKDKTSEYELKIEKLEESVRNLEQVNNRMQSDADAVEGGEGAASKTQKSHANVKNKIRKMQTELAESKRTIKEQSEKLEELNSKLEEKEQLIKNYIEKIELFEKDDWGRENDWKTTQDEFECMQELQKKCLTLENSLIELNEDCERLRKENIEVVHLLSEEKVKRKKLLEKLQARDECASVELDEAARTPTEDGSEMTSTSDDAPSLTISALEEKVTHLIEMAETLVNKLERLETKLRENDADGIGDADAVLSLEAVIKESQEKLEWSNIVLTSKETEIFRLQNLLEDNAKAMEDLERGIREANEKIVEKNERINEFVAELKKKEVQVEELSVNFEKLQESVIIENERTASNETQLKLLMATVQEMEGDAVKKENELKEIQAILAEKNLDIHNLKQWLEQVNSDLTYGYKEHLENMDKYLKDKEVEFDAVLAEKNELEEAKRSLEVLNEEVTRQRDELVARTKELETTLLEKTRIVEETRKEVSVATKQAEPSEDERTQEVNDLKIKIKKLAANLKKKVQNEKDLLQQIKEYEEYVGEKDATLRKLQTDLADVSEKWQVEKNEKDQFRAELAVVLSAKATAECENADLRDRLKKTEAEHEKESQKTAYKYQQMETQLRKMYEKSEEARLKLEEDKMTIANLESQLKNMTDSFEIKSRTVLSEADRCKEENEELRNMLAETCNRYESTKFACEELKMEKSKVEEYLKEQEIQNCELKTDLDRAITENSCLQAKLQEQLAVIESLENDLSQARDQMKRNEDKLCFLEERRSSLEGKNEEMLRRIEEDSKNLVLIEEMSNQMQSLAASEQNLKTALKAAEERKRAVEQECRDLVAEKGKLEKELKEFGERVSNLNEEVRRLHDVDAEKTETLEFLAKEAEKLKAVKMDHKQKCAEIEKLNKDVQLLEADLKENVENSKSVERTLNHKIEELMRENGALVERNNALMESKDQQEEPGKARRKKSVTFRTDETDYIRELKGKVHEYSESLKKSNDEVQELKMELLRQKVLHEVTEVVSEAKEKVESLRSSPVKTLEESERPTTTSTVEDVVAEQTLDASVLFAGAQQTQGGSFFDQQQVEGFAVVSEDSSDQVNINFDSLMWDDGWGTDGHLEEDYLSSKNEKSDTTDSDNFQKRIDELEAELKASQAEKERLEEELQVVQGKYAKALKKLKEMKASLDKSQSEMSRLKSDAEFGGLDGAIMDELKSQIAACEAREKELMKNVESAKLEKEGLLKRIEVLNAGNDKFMEMKERQDNEMELWETKNRELMKEIQELRAQLREQGESREVDESAIANENRQLKNRVEGLEWENCELKELLEEKQEMLELRAESSETNSSNDKSKEVAELTSAKEALESRLAEEGKRSEGAIKELQDQVNALAAENDTLQVILGEMKKSAEKAKSAQAPASPQPPPPPPPVEVPNQTEIKVFDYFKSAPANDVFSSVFAQPAAGQSDFLAVEAPMQRKVVQPVTADRSAEKFEKELERLRREKESLEQQLIEAQALAESVKREREEMVAEYQKALSSSMEEKNSALQKVYELEQALTVNVNREREEMVAEYEKALSSSMEEKNSALQKVYELEQALAANVNREREQIVAEYERALSAGVEEKNNALRKVYELEQALAVKVEEANNASARVRDLEQQVMSKAEEVNATVRGRQEYEQAYGAKAEECKNAMTRVTELQQVLSTTTGELDRAASRVMELENALKMKCDDLSNAVRGVSDLEAGLEAKTNEASRSAETIRQLEQALAVKTEEIGKLAARLRDAEEDARRKESSLSDLQRLNSELVNAQRTATEHSIPLETEIQSLTRALSEERSNAEDLRKAMSETERDLRGQTEEVKVLRERLSEAERRLAEAEREYDRQRSLTEEYCEAKEKLEDVASSLRTELETVYLELQLSRNEMEELRRSRERVVAEMEAKRDADSKDLDGLRSDLGKAEDAMREMERGMEELRGREEVSRGEAARLQTALAASEAHVDSLKSELRVKESDIFELSQALEQLRGAAAEKDNEIADLRQALVTFRDEISSFRNFEKQVKELRMAQIKQTGSGVRVTAEGDPDFANWTEHELAELNTRLQSDLDTALYMLHQRDLRCDELTFELMQLLEERDTLQLRLSTAIRINEDLRATLASGERRIHETRQESKDLTDQSNDRQDGKAATTATATTKLPEENMRELAQKISQLHSISYIRDKTIQDETMQRHADQMTLLNRVSDTDASRDSLGSSPPPPLPHKNWIVRGKSAPKVMHI